MNSSNLDTIEPVRLYDVNARKYRPKRLVIEESFGTVADFKRHYADNLTDVEGEIHIGAVTLRTSPRVMAALRAVLFTGCCYIEERAIACREVFTRGCAAGTYIDEETLLSTFIKDDPNPFVDTVQLAIREVFNE